MDLAPAGGAGGKPVRELPARVHAQAGAGRRGGFHLSGYRLRALRERRGGGARAVQRFPAAEDVHPREPRRQAARGRERRRRPGLLQRGEFQHLSHGPAGDDLRAEDGRDARGQRRALAGAAVAGLPVGGHSEAQLATRLHRRVRRAARGRLAAARLRAEGMARGAGTRRPDRRLLEGTAPAPRAVAADSPASDGGPGDAGRPLPPRRSRLGRRDDGERRAGDAPAGGSVQGRAAAGGPLRPHPADARRRAAAAGRPAGDAAPAEGRRRPLPGH